MSHTYLLLSKADLKSVGASDLRSNSYQDSDRSPSLLEKLLLTKTSSVVIGVALISLAINVETSAYFTKAEAVLVALSSITVISLVLALLTLLRRSRAAEARLEKQAAFTTALLDTIGAGIISCDMTGRITHINQEAQHRLGGGMVGDHLSKRNTELYLFESDGSTPVARENLPLIKAMRGETIRDEEILVKDPTGELRHLRVSGNTLRNDNGQTIGAVVAAHDVTELRHATQQLKEDSNRLTEIVDVQRSIFSQADNFAATLEVAADWAHKLSGGDGSAIQMVYGDELLYEGAAGSLVDTLGVQLRCKGSLSGVVIDTGTTQYCPDTFLDDRINKTATQRLNIRSMAIAPIRHRDETIGVLKIASSKIDAFEKRALLKLELVAEAVGSALAVSKLLDENRRLVSHVESQRVAHERLLTAISDQGVGVTVGEGDKIVFANEAFCELIGYTQEELLAMDSSSQLVGTPEERSEVARRRAAISAGTLNGRMEATVLNSSGEIIPIEFSSKRIDLDGREQRINVVRDIRLRRQWEDSLAEQAEALLRTNDELQDLQAMRADFLAAVTHDFRTPLTSILGYLELALDAEPQDQVSSISTFLKRIENAGNELQRRIETFLDFSRAERAGVEVECQPNNISTLVSDVVESLSPTFGERLTLTGNPECSALLDRRAFTRVIENLLTNAAKYSPVDSPVEVKVEHIDEEILITCSDRGSGIAPEDLDRIFESYFRAHDVLGSVRGSGIGLAAARQLVDAMGGRIWAENRSGGGTIFTVQFPALTNSAVA